MVAANDLALQQNARRDVPRPLPLFLDLVHRLAQQDAALASRVMAGLRRYQQAPRKTPRTRDLLASHDRASIRGCGKSGPPVLLVPSIINPSHVLDIDDDNSLLGWLADAGFRSMLLDWGTPAPHDAAQDISMHVIDLLLPLLAAIGEPVHMIGYCMGGTMATAAAQIAPVASLTQIATPWHFAAYPEESRRSMHDLWQANAATVMAMGQMPMELLQTAFWSLDPQRTASKYADIADLADDDARLARFVMIEDWSNDGAPLTAAAAKDLFDHFMAADSVGAGQWRVGETRIEPERLTIPAVHFTASGDKIVPEGTACRAIAQRRCPSGHVGMIVGSKARDQSFTPITEWLRSAAG